jgi:hypothetical protein
MPSASIAWYACSMSELTIARQAIAHRGRRLEYFTIAWNFFEGLIAVGAGVVAGSVSLVGFGMDSFIEVSSWATHSEHSPFRASRCISKATLNLDQQRPRDKE